MTNRSAIRYLYRRTHRRLPALFLLCAAHIGSTLLAVGFAVGSKNVINTATSGDRAAFAAACMTQGAIVLGSLLCLMLSRYLHDRLAADLDRDWKADLLHGLLGGDYAKISQYHSGELLNRLNNDVRQVSEGILSTLPGLVAMLTRLGAIAGVLWTFDPALFLLLFGLGLVVVALTGLARKRLKSLHKAVSIAEGKVMGFLQETFEKLLPVQAMDVGAEVERRADRLLQERYDLQGRRRRISLLANTCVGILSRVSAFGALVWCAWRMLNGTMTFGELTAITQLVSQLRSPMVNLSGFYPRYIAMLAAAERLMEIDGLCHRETEVQMADPKAIYPQMETITGENLTFSYSEDGEKVLNGGWFSIPKGSFVAVTGTSGSGKSTLLKLLLGIYPPTGGELILRWNSGESFDLDRTTRRLFAYVPQGNLLFSGTLRENLLLTRPEATEEEIEKAIFVSGMDRFLPTLPDGLDTMLGENAHGLSEGQAQRLSIARAVLSSAPILLLDECTSALDAETEQTVLQRLRGLEDKTCIAVTHRPAALELADVELECKDGRIEQKTIDS